MTLVVDNLSSNANIRKIKNYLNVLAEFFDNAGDGLDMVLQQLPGKQLLFSKALGPIKTGRDVLLDAGGLFQEKSYGALLGAQPVFQLISLGVWNDRKKRMTPGKEKETTPELL